MDRFAEEARLLARRRIGALLSLLALLAAVMALQEWTARGAEADRRAEARTREEIARVSRVTNMARRVVDAAPDRAGLAARIRAEAEAFAAAAVCRREALGWRVEAPPAVAALYAGVADGASLCTLKERFFRDAMRVADRADRAAFARMFETVNDLRERLNAAATGYAALSAARSDRVLWTSRAALAGLFVLLILQNRLVIARGLGALVAAHREIARGLAELRVSYANVQVSRTDLAAALRASEAARAEADEARLAEARAHALKSEFLARLSHEVRTPLNAVLGFGALMTAEERPDADRERLAAIQRAATTLMSLFDDMIELSRLGAGDARFESAPFEPGALAAREIAAVARDAGPIALVVAPAAEGRFAADARRIGRILRALLDNALRHGGAPVSVRVDAWAGAGLRIEVEDRGPGVPDAAREAIFAPFMQADGSATRASGGLGIGLALARETVRAMGGAIGVGDAPGGGARFWVEIPAMRLVGFASAAPGRAAVRS